MGRVLYIFDFILFLWIFPAVVYLLIFAIHSQRKSPEPYPGARSQHRMLVLFPAYKEDAVIEESIRSFLGQDYPHDLFQIVVISDRMRKEKVKQLRRLPVMVLDARFEQSSKAAALNLAISHLQDQAFDIVAIMDADNTAAPDFLRRINDAYDYGIQAIQVHRTSKGGQSDLSILDTVSEEVNNSIFREGHVHAGLSSALIGSGMAFDYNWFVRHIPMVTTAGEDKELELLLLKDNIYIDYLSDVYVYDEKVSSTAAFYRQRRRWIAAQLDLLGKGICYLPKAITSGNLDYCDKIFQWLQPPRILLAGFTFLSGVVWLFLEWTVSLKWWMAFLLLFIALSLAMPDKLYNHPFRKALLKLPILFLLMVVNLFRTGGVNSRFIHTRHGGKRHEDSH